MTHGGIASPPEVHSCQQGTSIDDSIHAMLQGLLQQQLPDWSGRLGTRRQRQTMFSMELQYQLVYAKDG
jgi:hypothetical protein